MKTSVGAEQSLPPSAPSTRVCDLDQAQAYVAMICFKHGPPTLYGVELEWTVHDLRNPSRPVSAQQLSTALADHAPPTINPRSAHLPLPAGSLVTVEPGGQVEISAPPLTSAGDLISAATADSSTLTGLIEARGLVLGQQGFDQHRPPTRILDSPRYEAMQAAFEAIGPHGSQMMCSTASVQVCLDAGEAHHVADRWRAVHAFGPTLVALFANSPGLGRSGWASSRLRATLGTCPPTTSPPELTADPASQWAQTAMDAPVICVLGDGRSWKAPRGLTFADWISHPDAIGRPPTFADLDYHLTTLFPPVRPKGYLEIRYLDAQTGQGWAAAFALIAALMARPATVDRVLELTDSTADRWLEAAHQGWASPVLRAAAHDLVQLGVDSLPDLGLSATQESHIIGDLDVRVNRASTAGSAESRWSA